MNDRTDREQTIAGLRKLANLLEANPGVPVSPSHNSKTITFHVSGETEESKRAVVDLAAAVLGVQPSGTTHYSAIRRFPGGVEYQVLAITDAHMAEYRALMSYDGVVQPAEVTS